eukprot:TRINITY_DN32730_c0_g1_i1.p1 TRINITY_DN32730_c0_g1~~TRINITY_DN32730_c0_g1_i1.p1  ORF type:complete len:604 (-),score=89.73 TRINITY_DN32730_c0_g1_i1:211-2022(-)
MAQVSQSPLMAAESPFRSSLELQSACGQIMRIKNTFLEDWDDDDASRAVVGRRAFHTWSPDSQSEPECELSPQPQSLFRHNECCFFKPSPEPVSADDNIVGVDLLPRPDAFQTLLSWEPCSSGVCSAPPPSPSQGSQVTYSLLLNEDVSPSLAAKEPSVLLQDLLDGDKAVSVLPCECALRTETTASCSASTKRRMRRERAIATPNVESDTRAADVHADAFAEGASVDDEDEDENEAEELSPTHIEAPHEEQGQQNDTEIERQDQQVTDGRKKGRGGKSKRNKLWCHIFINPAMLDRAFALTKKIIGCGGENTWAIFDATGAKIRLRGRGSGHLEGGREADVHLMLAVTADLGQEDNFQRAAKMSLELLDEVALKWAHFCRVERRKQGEGASKAVNCTHWVGDASEDGWACLPSDVPVASPEAFGAKEPTAPKRNGGRAHRSSRAGATQMADAASEDGVSVASPQTLSKTEPTSPKRKGGEVHGVDNASEFIWSCLPSDVPVTGPKVSGKSKSTAGESEPAAVKRRGGQEQKGSRGGDRVGNASGLGSTCQSSEVAVAKPELSGEHAPRSRKCEEGQARRGTRGGRGRRSGGDGAGRADLGRR